MCKRSFIHKIIRICKESGIIYRSSYIYEGLKGFVDYGPVGAILKHNVRGYWFEYFNKPYNYKLESSVILNRKVWFASKHSKFFLDFTVDCRFSKKRFNTGLLVFFLIKTKFLLKTLCLVFNKNLGLVLGYKLKIFLLKKKLNLLDNHLVKFSFKKGGLLLKKRLGFSLLPSPISLRSSGLLNLKKTNLMFFVNSTNTERTKAKPLFLRPETAQGSFINFLNIKSSFSRKLPFGILQSGKVFRNETATKQFSNRIKEFDQLETHFFVKNESATLFIYFKKMLNRHYKWLVLNGIPPSKLLLEKIKGSDKLSHYSKFCVDILFISSLGNIELEGISVRGGFDLKQHSKYSNCCFKFFDKKKGSFYFPYVIEPSIGLDRLILAILECSLLYKRYSCRRVTYFFNFPINITPYKVSIFPLLKNNSFIKIKSLKVFANLNKKLNIFYSFEGSIGKRYLKSDNMGIPFSVTVDFLSISKNVLTVRYRNNSRQFKIKLEDVSLFFNKRFN